MTRHSSVAAIIISVVLITAAHLSARQGPPPIPATPGTAAGTVQAGGKTITLAHAYVGVVGDGLYEVVLTDAPVPAAAIATEVRNGGGQQLLRSGKVNGISMLVDADGSLRNIIPFIGDMRGSSMLASAGRLNTFTASAKSVTGQGSKTAAETMNQGWSYSASWHAVPLVIK